MSPEQLLRFEKMERELDGIKRVTDTSFVAELTRRLSGIQIRIEPGASTTGTSVSVRNASDTGSETVAEQYTSVASLYLNGTLIGRIGYY